MIDWTKVKTAEKKAEEAQVALVKSLENAVDQHIRAIYNIKGYDSENSLSKYMARPSSPWHTECVALGDWIDSCWLKCHEVLNAVTAGERAIPTEAELIAELPAFSWP